MLGQGLCLRAAALLFFALGQVGQDGLDALQTLAGGLFHAFKPLTGGLFQLVLHVHGQTAEYLGDDLLFLLVRAGVLLQQRRAAGQTAAAEVVQRPGCAGESLPIWERWPRWTKRVPTTLQDRGSCCMMERLALSITA